MRAVSRWVILALGLLVAGALPAATQDVTGQFAIARSGLELNRGSGTLDATVRLTNVSGAPVLAPIRVVVGGLPGAVTLANRDGQTDDGKPYVSPLAAGTLLSSGATLSLQLKFANPQGVAFSSILQVLYAGEVQSGGPSVISVVATGGTNALVVGRVEGAANQSITLRVSAASTCVEGILVGAAAIGGLLTTTTDSDGYFGVAVSGVNPGAFVSVQRGSPPAAPMSACLVSARDNDSWPKAFTLTGSPATVQDFIDVPGKARWYKFSVTPGQRLEVKLTGLPADYDLAVFKDIGQAFANQFNPATAGTADLLKLTAEYAPSVFSPSVFSPSVFSPDAYSPSVFSPSVFSPSVFSPSVFSPSVFSPSVFSPSVFSPSVFSPSVFSPSVFSPSVFSPSVFSATEIAQAFSTAQTRSIVGVAATEGTGDESLVVNTWNSTGNFYVRVVGHDGAFNTSRPFTLTVSKGATSCSGVTDTTLIARPAVAAAGLKTVLVTDSSRVALDAAVPGGGTLRARLTALAGRVEVKGMLVDVAGDARVSALKQQAANNPACPFATNLVASEIKGIVDSYRANPLQYVVLVGNDRAIPFFRTPDESGLGQESGYVPPVQSNSSSEASLRLDYVLSQDGYGSKVAIVLPSNDFPVPGLAVGRLVETPVEMAGVIDAYLAANGVVMPASSLATGYDFLAQAAEAVMAELTLGIGAGGVADALITPGAIAPQDPRSWTASDLAQALFGKRHDVIFLGGHFSANSALAADFATSLVTTDLAAAGTDFSNVLVFSAGCHAGYNLVDSDAIPGVTLPLDWAQAFARKRATLIAGTGYQYGDTDFIEYSEQIYLNLARQMRAGSGPVAVGAALVAAKLDYLASTPDIRGIHEKALLEATLFGLPMLAVNMPAGRGAGPGGGGAITPQAVAAGPAQSLGLKSYDLSLAPSLTPHAQSLKNVQGGPDIVAHWLSGPDGVVSKPGEPVLPLVALNVTPTDPSVVLRGVAFRGGSYVDSAPLFPFSSAPTTELRGVHVPFVSPVFYPGRMWNPNYFGALAGSGGTQLLVTPVQHRAAELSVGTSIQRRYSGLDLRLYYSGNLSQAALSEAPVIIGQEAMPDAGGVRFTVQVIGNPAAALHQVWVTYTSDGSSGWTSLDLAQCVAPLPTGCGTIDSRRWTGRLAAVPPGMRYLVQAVNGVGLVALDDNRGAYYGLGGATPTATTLALVAPPAAATLGESVALSARLSFAGVALADKLVVIAVGGTAQVVATGSDGGATVYVPLASAPGSYPISASFAGDDLYLPSSATATVTVARAAASLAALVPAGVTLSGNLGGSITGLPQEAVSFAVSGPGGATTIWANTNNLGRATLPPPGLAAGTYTVTQASFGGNATYLATSVPLSQQFTVAKLAQSISFEAVAARSFGDPDFAVYASASSGLDVALAASGACVIAGSTVQISGPGSCTLTATQTGDDTYGPATPRSQTFDISARTISNAQPAVTLDAGGGATVMVRQSDGKVIVAGSFTKANGSARSNLARFTADGTLDAAFDPAPDGPLTAVVVGGSSIYVAGHFTHIGGVARLRMAKLSMVDGSVDPAFDPAPDSDVTGLAADVDGNVYAAGSFTAIGGRVGQMLVKLDGATGVAVSGWNPAFPEALTAVSAIAVNGAHCYVVGHLATDVNALIGRAYRVARATGAHDPTWTPPAARLGNEGHGVSIAFGGTGDVFIAGPGGMSAGVYGASHVQVPIVTVEKFLGSTGATAGAWAVPASGTGFVIVDGGSVYTTEGQLPFGGTGGSSVTLAKRSASTGALASGWSNPDVALGFTAAAVAAPEGIWIAGEFSSINGSRAAGLARLDAATGSLQGGFASRVTYPGYGLTIVALPDGKFLAGGHFDYVNGLPRTSLIRLNQDGTPDATWTTATNGEVWRLAVHGAYVYAGGFFTTAGGAPHSGAARFDIATGAVDPAWNPNADGGVRRFAFDGVDVYLGGSFTSVGGAPRTVLAKVSGVDGAPIGAFAPPLNAPCFVGTQGLAYADGFVYSGTTSCLSAPFQSRRLGRFSSTTGAYDSSWNPAPDGGATREILVSGADMFIVGDFTTVNGIAKQHLAKIAAATGALDAAWGDAPSTQTITYTAAIAGDYIYIGGGRADSLFALTDPMTGRHALATGLRDIGWNLLLAPIAPNHGYGVPGLAVSLTGDRVFISGNFNAVSGQHREGFAAFAAP